MKKKKILFGLVGSTLCLFVFIVILNLKYDNAVIIENEKSRTTVKNTNALTMMYETEANSGEYQVLDSDTWIQDGYIFNTELSRCENGSEIYYNSVDNKVYVETTTADKCYVYFDKYGYYLNNKILEDNPTVLTRNDFDSVFVDENVGTLFKVEGNRTEDIDNDGVGEAVYYFSGNALNNWVKFGKNENGEDLYWRIIRINEDGGIRLLYVGNSVNSTNAYIATSSFNDYIYDETDDKKYSGYMYGNSGTLDDYRLNTYDSTIKIAIDNWYEKSILINSDINGYVFDEYVSKSAIYCNDRATMNNLSYYYGAYNRLEIVLDDKIRKPSYNCGIDQNGELLNASSIDDKFSASDVIGNGKLKYPVALMTADEISFAGGLAGSSLTSPYAYYYLNANNESVTGTLAWWTLSPNQSYGDNIQNYIISGSGNPGFLGNVYNNKVYGVRPVLSLKSCTFWSNGNGSSISPYEVFIDNACSSVEN